MVVLVVVGVLVLTGTCALVTRSRAEAPPTLVWSEEFDAAALDAASWEPEHLSTFGDGNEELACLTDRPENLVITGGELVLVARRESPPLYCGSRDARFPGGRNYSSAFVSTEGKRSWQHPRVEVRAALPLQPLTSKGLWPAAWMRPDDKSPGEIDILEGVGSGTSASGTLHQTLHYRAGDRPAQITHEVDLPAGFDPTQFHVYAVDVRSDRVDWEIDGQTTFSVSGSDVPGLSAMLNGTWFLRLNLAVGGTWPGSPTSATELPAQMRVDWVRVYEHAS